MSRSLKVFAVILAGIYVVLSLLDYNGQYVAEQLHWRANKRLATAALDPKTVPDNVFDAIAADYQRIIARFPDSPLTRQAHIDLARVYLVKKDFETARLKSGEVLKKYPDDLNLCAQASAIIAQSYESAGDWPSALAVYNDLTAKYTLTDIGLSTPLYIANSYEVRYDAALAKQSYESAEAYYQDLASRHTGSEGELKSLRWLANCYMQQKKWESGVETLGRVLLRSAALGRLEPGEAAGLLKTINTVCVLQLWDYDRPVRIYLEFIKENPGHRLNKFLTGMIRTLSTLKEKHWQPKDQMSLPAGL